MCVGVTVWFGWSGVVSLCRLKHCFSLHKEELEHVFDHVPKYHIRILLGDFKAKLARNYTFKPTIGNDSLRKDSNDNGVRILNFVASKNLLLKSTMFRQRNLP
jgi:hypothetical protein